MPDLPTSPTERAHVMFHCPHCGKTIEMDSPTPVPWWQYQPAQRSVSLGCGTLIIIAIIVAMFSQSGDESKSIRDLQRDIQKLQRTVDTLQTQPVSTSADDRGDANDSRD
jgi:hypothetical protein